MATKIEDIKGKDVQEVALPGFVPEEPFIVRLRRPSLLLLAREGKIPNALLGAAAKLFGEGLNSGDTGPAFKEMGEAMVYLAKAAMVEPTYEELEKAEISLTDAQLTDIYLYTQKGVQSLDLFRALEGTKQGSESGKSAKQDAKRSAGN